MVPERPVAEMEEQRGGAADLLDAVLLAFETALGVPVDPDDDFFGLGGDSLSSMAVVSDLGQMLDLAINPTAVLTYPTARSLTEAIESRDALDSDDSGEAWEAPPNDDAELVPIWPIQENQLLVAAYSASRGFLSWVYQLNGRLQPDALADALDEVVERFPILRTTFEQHDGAWYQRVHPFVPGVMRFVDLTGGPREEALEEAFSRSRATYESLSPFDDPRLQATLYAVTPKRHVLAIFVAEALVDGDGGALLSDEISHAYATRAGEPPSDLPLASPVSFVSHVAANPVSGRQLREDREHWERLLGQAPPGLGWAPPSDEGAMAFSVVAMPPEEWDALLAVVQAAQTTPYVFMFSNLMATLERAAGAGRLLVTSVVRDYSARETDGMMGCFHSSVLLDSRVLPGDRFTDVVARSAATVREAIDHAAVPAPLVMCDPTSPSYLPPTAGVHFYMFEGREGPVYPGVRRRRYRLHGSSREALRLNCTQDAKATRFFTFSSSVTPPETLDELADAFRGVLAATLADPTVPLADIDLHAASDRWHDPRPG